jgi:hypothetical protein
MLPDDEQTTSLAVVNLFMLPDDVQTIALAVNVPMQSELI